MIREYAVDPDAIYQNKHSIQRFLSEFNAEHGRVVSEVPRKWYEEHRAKIRECFKSPVARRTALDNLIKIKNSSLVSGYVIPNNIEAWIDKALYAKNNSIMDAIISTRRCDESQIYCYEDLLEDTPKNWEIGNTIAVERSANGLVNCIKYSLKLATTVFYVDPYFTPADNRFVAPLIAFINAIKSGRFSTNEITIHTTTKNGDAASFLNGLDQIVKPLLPLGFTIKLFIWQQEKIHDRFILTKNVGYAFGHGLDEAAYFNSLKVNVNRLSEDFRSEQFKLFSMKDDINDKAIIVTR